VGRIDRKQTEGRAALLCRPAVAAILAVAITAVWNLGFGVAATLSADAGWIALKWLTALFAFGAYPADLAASNRRAFVVSSKCSQHCLGAGAFGSH